MQPREHGDGGRADPYASPDWLDDGAEHALRRAYVAYEPDGGTPNGRAFHGLQTIHYEDGNTFLCGNVLPTSAPTAIPFASAVQSLALSPDFGAALAITQGGAAASVGGYGLAQDVFGVSVGEIVPAGSPYDLTVQPTPVPTTAPSPGTSPVPTATATGLARIVTDATSVVVFPFSTGSYIGLTTGPAASAIVGLTSITNAPPQYGEAVSFADTTFTHRLANVPRSNLAVAANGSALLARRPFGSLLVRGHDGCERLRNQCRSRGHDARNARGHAWRRPDRVRSGRSDAGARGSTTAGGSNVLTLITGLPAAITHTSQLALPASINSIAIDSTGAYAYIATTAGIYSVSGIATGTLALAPSFVTRTAGAPSVLTYTNCNRVAARMTNVSSVRISNDSKYIVALGNAPNTVCPLANYNSAVVAVPILPSTNTTPSPGPTVAAANATATPFVSKFVQNNVITPPSAADYFMVR